MDEGNVVGGVQRGTRDGTGDTAVPWYTSPLCPVCTNWYSYPGHRYYNIILLDMKCTTEPVSQSRVVLLE